MHAQRENNLGAAGAKLLSRALETMTGMQILGLVSAESMKVTI
jgi:hypothetical protein